MIGASRSHSWRKRRREIAAGTWTPPVERVEAAKIEALTLAGYAEGWFVQRREAGCLSATQEEADLRRFVLAAIGEKPIGRVSRSDVKAVTAAMRAP